MAVITFSTGVFKSAWKMCEKTLPGDTHQKKLGTFESFVTSSVFLYGLIDWEPFQKTLCLMNTKSPSNEDTEEDLEDKRYPVLQTSVMILEQSYKRTF